MSLCVERFSLHRIVFDLLSFTVCPPAFTFVSPSIYIRVTFDPPLFLFGSPSFYLRSTFVLPSFTFVCLRFTFVFPSLDLRHTLNFFRFTIGLSSLLRPSTLPSTPFPRLPRGGAHTSACVGCACAPFAGRPCCRLSGSPGGMTPLADQTGVEAGLYEVSY